LLAANMFILGFLVCGACFQVKFNRTMSEMRDIMESARIANDMANLAAQKLGEAINEGRVEVIPIQPDDKTQPTRH